MRANFLADTCRTYTKSFGKVLARPFASSEKAQYFSPLCIRQFAIGMFFSTHNRFRMQAHAISITRDFRAHVMFLGPSPQPCGSSFGVLLEKTTPLAIHILNIVSMCAKPEMRRVHAVRSIHPIWTVVQNMQARVWPCTVVEIPTHDMGTNLAPSFKDIKSAIALSYGSPAPYPAFVRRSFVYLAPEAISKRSKRSLFERQQHTLLRMITRAPLKGRWEYFKRLTTWCVGTNEGNAANTSHRSLLLGCEDAPGPSMRRHAGFRLARPTRRPKLYTICA